MQSFLCGAEGDEPNSYPPLYFAAGWELLTSQSRRGVKTKPPGMGPKTRVVRCLNLELGVCLINGIFNSRLQPSISHSRVFSCMGPELETFTH